MAREKYNLFFFFHITVRIRLGGKSEGRYSRTEGFTPFPGGAGVGNMTTNAETEKSPSDGKHGSLNNNRF